MIKRLIYNEYFIDVRIKWRWTATDLGKIYENGSKRNEKIMEPQTFWTGPGTYYFLKEQTWFHLGEFEHLISTELDCQSQQSLFIMTLMRANQTFEESTFTSNVAHLWRLTLVNKVPPHNEHTKSISGTRIHVFRLTLSHLSFDVHSTAISASNKITFQRGISFWEQNGKKTIFKVISKMCTVHLFPCLSPFPITLQSIIPYQFQSIVH